MNDLIEVKDRLLKEIKAEVIKDCKDKLLLQLELREISYEGQMATYNNRCEINFFRKIVNNL